MSALTALQKAVAGWGEPLPDWVQVLAARIDAESQSRVATAVGYSDSAISQALRNCYRGGDIAAVEAAVRGAFMGTTVACPVLGQLEVNKCLHHQRQPFRATNSQRVRLFKACRRCTHRRNA